MIVSVVQVDRDPNKNVLEVVLEAFGIYMKFRKVGGIVRKVAKWRYAQSGNEWINIERDVWNMMVKKANAIFKGGK